MILIIVKRRSTVFGYFYFAVARVHTNGGDAVVQVIAEGAVHLIIVGAVRIQIDAT